MSNRLKKNEDQMSNRISLLVLSALIISSNAFSMEQYDYVGSPTTIGNQVESLNWCGCDFLAAVGIGALGDFIQIYGFDQNTRILSTIGNTILLNDSINTVEWCGTCSYLAVSGSDELGNGLIQIYSFNSLNPGNLELTSTMTVGESISTLDWCQGCSFLAAGGSTEIGGFIQAFTFDGSNLTATGNLVPLDIPITSLKWCSDCSHLVAVGSTNFPTIVGFISIYSFNPENPGTLELAYSQTMNANINAVDECNNCQFIAVGGKTNESPSRGFIDIFSFDSRATPTLSLVASTTISDEAILSIVRSLNWCGCGILAVGGGIASFGDGGVVQLYHFDELETLSLQQTFSVGSGVYSVNWCGPCAFLAAGGLDSQYP